MNNQDQQPAGQLPSYITSATPNPPEKRAPWYANTAPTYAGIFLWFVFWQDAVNAPNAGGMLSQGVGWALVSLVLAALVCHFLFYLVPGLLGHKDRPAALHRGHLDLWRAGRFSHAGIPDGGAAIRLGRRQRLFSPRWRWRWSSPCRPRIIMVVWGVLAAFAGLKGIQYVAKVATYLPLIPLAILLILLAKTAGTIGDFDPQKFIALHKSLTPNAPEALSSFGVLAFMMTFVVGFFATAGAAGVDFGTNSRDKKDVQMGGLVGVALAIIVTAGISLLVVAGTYGSPEFSKARGGGDDAAAKANPPGRRA